MIGILYLLLALIKACSSFKSAAWRTKESAIQSTSREIAKTASSLSFVVSAGKEIFVFGRLTPLRERKGPPCITLVFTSDFPSVESTSNINFPSSRSTRSPFLTSLGKLL